MLSSVTPNTDNTPDFGSLTPFLAVIGIVYLAILIIMIIAYAKIIGKAGYSPWWVLMMFVPIGNLIVFFMFAFSEWPIQRRVRELEALAGSGGGRAAYPQQAYGQDYPQPAYPQPGYPQQPPAAPWGQSSGPGN